MGEYQIGLFFKDHLHLCTPIHKVFIFLCGRAVFKKWIFEAIFNIPTFLDVYSLTKFLIYFNSIAFFKMEEYKTDEGVGKENKDEG